MDSIIVRHLLIFYNTNLLFSNFLMFLSNFFSLIVTIHILIIFFFCLLHLFFSETNVTYNHHHTQNRTRLLSWCCRYRQPHANPRRHRRRLRCNKPRLRRLRGCLGH